MREVEKVAVSWVIDCEQQPQHPSAIPPCTGDVIGERWGVEGPVVNVCGVRLAGKEGGGGGESGDGGEEEEKRDE